MLALTAQFTVGYVMDVGDSGRGRGRGRGRGEGSGRGRGRGRGGDLDVFGDPLFTAHVFLGAAIIVLAVVRLGWRRHAGLPPWAAGLSRFERTLAHVTERTLYALLIIVPASGLWLLLVNDDALALHVAAHIVFFAVFALHLGLVLKHQLINRDHLLRRML